jgi:nucleotide-binding universal stress UspA family protein
MTAIRSLLAATDFSEGASLALRRAAQLASALGVPLQVLHVTDADEDAARERLARAIADLRTPASFRVQGGSVPEAILDAAGEHDLLVLGARGAGGLREALLGSTAERLLIRTTRPILIVRRPAGEPYRHVIVPCEYAPPAKRALAMASSVAPGATITLLHCLEDPGQEARVHEWLRRLAAENAADRAFNTRVEHGPPAAAVLALAASAGADLIVAGKQGRSRTAEFFLGGVTRRILAGATCDVLVAPLSSTDS